MLARVVAILLVLWCTVGASGTQGRVAIDGGRQLYLLCRGVGSPTVVLDGGLRERGDIWSRADLVPPKAVPVMVGVEKFTRVCEYDRPGTLLGPKTFSRSDPVPMPRRATQVVADLHDLLRNAKVPGPYVLVGHSFGGLHILLYELTYPKTVAGMVFVDAFLPQLRSSMAASQWKTYIALSRQPIAGIQYKDIEALDFDASVDDVQHALAQSTLPSVPAVVLTKGKPFDLTGLSAAPGFGRMLDAAWARAQRRFAASIPHGTLIVVDTSHNIMNEQPMVVVNAIRRVVVAARSAHPR